MISGYATHLSGQVFRLPQGLHKKRDCAPIAHEVRSGTKVPALQSAGVASRPEVPPDPLSPSPVGSGIAV
jgi:hypothetical protein